MTKRILIACQSTIPHYRIAFYQEIERIRPNSWRHYVVFDENISSRRKFFNEDIELNNISFNIKNTRTGVINIFHKQIAFQTFVFNAWKYDLIVVGNSINNLSYPMSMLFIIIGRPVIIWGHGKDWSIPNPKGIKRLLERVKIKMARKADGFFAYTDGVKKHLVENGVDEGKIFVLNNTIDIIQQRRIFESLSAERKRMRRDLGVSGDRTLLYVGRMNRRKKLDFLTEAFSVLRKRDKSYKLQVVGSGDMSMVDSIRKKHGQEAVTYHGIITEPEQLSQMYVASDVYVFPGDVGLGTLQALCYDLTPIVIDSQTHNPEYEYLNEKNAVILPEGSSPTDYAEAIDNLLHNKDKWMSLRAQAWPSIRHLTIENMAQNFIRGINTVLGQE